VVHDARKRHGELGNTPPGAEVAPVNDRLGDDAAERVARPNHIVVRDVAVDHLHR
jgi:hypothetical protein